MYSLDEVNLLLEY